MCTKMVPRILWYSSVKGRLPSKVFLKSSIFVVHKATAPKLWVEFCQGFIGVIFTFWVIFVFSEGTEGT